MKWKEYNRGSSSNEPVKFKDVSEIVPDRDGFGSLGSNAAFLIDEYVGDIARRWYSNGRIPENEERAITDAPHRSIRGVRLLDAGGRGIRGRI